MNDYALAKLLHNEYETTFSNPDTNENVQFRNEIRLSSVVIGLPLAVAIFSAILF